MRLNGGNKFDEGENGHPFFGEHHRAGKDQGTFFLVNITALVKTKAINTSIPWEHFPSVHLALIIATFSLGESYGEVTNA